MNRALAAALSLLVLCGTAWAQTLPPTNAPPPVKLNTNPSEEAKCKGGGTWFVEHPAILPMAAACRKGATQTPPKTADQYILEFYNRSNGLLLADQVQFLYGFGGEQQKSLSADLVGLIFPGGVRAALGSSLTSQPSGQTPTPAEAIDQLRNGGDLYVTVAYPLLAKQKGTFLGSLWAEPRLNMVFNGFGGTNTITQATESAYNIGIVGFAQLGDLTGTGAAFVSGRWGIEHVGPDFETSAGLTAQHFQVLEIALGGQFGDSVRIMVQKFKAPPGAAGVTLDQLTGWHIVFQFAPKAGGS